MSKCTALYQIVPNRPLSEEQMWSLGFLQLILRVRWNLYIINTSSWHLSSSLLEIQLLYIKQYLLFYHCARVQGWYRERERNTVLCVVTINNIAFLQNKNKTLGHRSLTTRRTSQLSRTKYRSKGFRAGILSCNNKHHIYSLLIFHRDSILITILQMKMLFKGKK